MRDEIQAMPGRGCGSTLVERQQDSEWETRGMRVIDERENLKVSK